MSGMQMIPLEMACDRCHQRIAIPPKTFPNESDLYRYLESLIDAHECKEITTSELTLDEPFIGFE